MAGNIQLPRRGDFSRDARENGSAFQSLRSLHCGTRRYPKCRGTGRGRTGVSNARRVQQAAIQKASETSVNVPRPAEFVPAETDRRCPGYPCTSTASNSLLCFSARYPHSDPCEKPVDPRLLGSALSHATRNHKQRLLEDGSRCHSPPALL